MSAEEIYQQMMRNSSLDKQYADLMAEVEPSIKLNQENSDVYLREIIQGGGAPSLLEISELLSELKTARQVSNGYKIRKLGRRAWYAFMDEDFQEDAIENRELEFAQTLSGASQYISQGNIERAYTELDKIKFT